VAVARHALPTWLTGYQRSWLRPDLIAYALPVHAMPRLAKASSTDAHGVKRADQTVLDDHAWSLVPARGGGTSSGPGEDPGDPRA
jgi:hypothetical protein